MNPCIIFTVFNKYRELQINLELLKKYAGINLPIFIITNNRKFPNELFRKYNIVSIPRNRGIQNGELDLITEGIKHSKKMGHDYTVKITADKFVIYPEWLKIALSSFIQFSRSQIRPYCVDKDNINYIKDISNGEFYYVPNAGGDVWPTYILSQIYLGFVFPRRNLPRNSPQIRTDIFIVNNNFALKSMFPNSISNTSCIEAEFFNRISKIYPPVFSPWDLLSKTRHHNTFNLYLNGYIFHSHTKENIINFLQETNNKKLISYLEDEEECKKLLS